MAPIRRYLRISKVAALEVRIYLEKPSDTPWLLSSRDPALPRIIRLIQPKILPKLREENENSKKKGSKKKRNIKDVASQDDFEVAMFLTDSSTRHSLITKHKQFADKPPIKSTSRRLTGVDADDAIDLSKDDEVPGLRKEETADSLDINNIPNMSGDDEPQAITSDEDAFQTQQSTRNGRRRVRQTFRQATLVSGEDDKKKLAVNTTYDSFSIYGKILCLIVKRKGSKTSSTVAARNGASAGGNQMMEQWVSTQADAAPDLDDAND